MKYDTLLAAIATLTDEEQKILMPLLCKAKRQYKAIIEQREQAVANVKALIEQAQGQ